MEFALGAALRPAEAAQGRHRRLSARRDMEPGDVRTLDALAQALLNDNQLDEALKQYKAACRGRS